MVWAFSETDGFCRPCSADSFLGCEAAQGLEPLGEAVGCQERLEVLTELIVVVVVIAADGGIFQGPVHAFDLSVRPGMVRLLEPVLDSVL